MQGHKGRVPKREDQRRRTNKDVPIEKVTVVGEVSKPPLRPKIHPLAQAWYDALEQSGQSRFYEPSDWVTAQVIAEAIESFVNTPRANMLSVILTGATSLLATEGDRRRLRLELTRASASEVAEAHEQVTDIADYRAL